jgi:hypothetical protein
VPLTDHDATLAIVRLQEQVEDLKKRVKNLEDARDQTVRDLMDTARTLRTEIQTLSLRP